MVNGRNSSNFLARLSVLGLSLVIFVLVTSPVLAFNLLVSITLAVGLLTTIIFIVMIDEKRLS